MGWVGQSFFILTFALAACAHGQSSVRGQLPKDAFTIDTSRVAQWDSRAASTSAAKEFSARQVEAQSLDRWQHEFPAQHSRFADEELEMEKLEFEQVDGRKLDPEDRSDAMKRSAFGTLVANDKWSRRVAAGNEQVSKQADTEVDSAFIAQVGIRPLEEQELQEKLNQYSKPPELRTKSSPLLPRKSSKH